MTPPAELEQKFLDHVSFTAAYHAEAVARGAKLWWLDEERLAELERAIPGISLMEPIERRRALFMKHHAKEITR